MLPFDLRPMDVIVTRDKTPLSWMIRRETKQRFSHVCLGGAEVKGRPTIYTTAASFLRPLGSFTRTDAETYLRGKTYAVFRHPYVKAIHQQAGLWKCQKDLGKQYDYPSLFALLLNWKIDNDSLYCAEQVTICYLYMGFALSAHLRKKPNEMLPYDCVDPEMELVFTNDKQFG